MLFKDIKLIEQIQKALVKTNYIEATPIQSKAIPFILEGHDLFGIAQTGTGKTAAFTLPILQLMFNSEKPKSTYPRTLILTPTRELAAQIGDSIKEYGSFTKFKHTVIFGGVAQNPQERALRAGCDIVIATPGRLLDLINQKVINLSKVEYFILDEADRMLDMGFINDVKKIIAKLPTKRQSLFFSATMSKTISDLGKKFLINPRKVEIKPEVKTTERIEQGLYYVNTKDKDDLLVEIINKNKIKTALVFTRTKHKSDKIAKFLNKKNIRCEAIHGNKSQGQRTNTLKDFKDGKIKILVATEIVARGIDIDGISHVINYEIPNEPESYVHRIGRTGRAGATGVAFSFAAADERNYVHQIEKLIGKEIPIIEHDRHSNTAQFARGLDAKPLPKGQNERKAKSAFTHPDLVAKAKKKQDKYEKLRDERNSLRKNNFNIVKAKSNIKQKPNNNKNNSKNTTDSKLKRDFEKTRSDFDNKKSGFKNKKLSRRNSGEDKGLERPANSKKKTGGFKSRTENGKTESSYKSKPSYNGERRTSNSGYKGKKK